MFKNVKCESNTKYSNGDCSIFVENVDTEIKPISTVNTYTDTPIPITFTGRVETM